MPEWTCSDSIRRGSQSEWNRGNREGLLSQPLLCGLPGRPIPSFVAQQVAAIAKETPLSHQAQHDSGSNLGLAAEFQLQMTGD
jgi:hypothetical protein